MFQLLQWKLQNNSIEHQDISDQIFHLVLDLGYISELCKNTHLPNQEFDFTIIDNIVIHKLSSGQCNSYLSI